MEIARESGCVERGVYIAFLVFVVAAILLNTGFAFPGFSDPTEGEWFNTSWHYRMRVEINSTAVARTDWPVELSLNFSDMLPGGTFDNNSIRVIEYNNTGDILHEVPSQFDPGDGYNNVTNAIGEVVFIMNGTTSANTKRIFYVYFDIAENNQKEAPSYSTNLTYTWDGQIATVNNTRLHIRIDTNRADNTSGIYYVEETLFFVPVLTVDAANRTAEYIELFNGSLNTTFDLRGNLSIREGPVRITLRQEGPEVVFGDLGQETGEGRVIKKYHIYNRAGAQEEGSFIKISQEVFSNNTAINRSNTRAGALALDLERSFLSTDISSQNTDTSDPYSWTWASDSGGSVAGIINLNESVPEYFSVNDTGLGRIGINLSQTEIPSGSSIRETALVYFARGGSDGVSEFLNVKDGYVGLVNITQNLTEKWSVIITPSINATIFNRNETLLIKGDISNDDSYTLVSMMNATLDLGTPSTTDDIEIVLYDDGTNGDETASDRIFTNNYIFQQDATVGEWQLNITAYGNSTEYFNSTIFLFNVTDTYYVNIDIFNPIGVTERQVVANVTVNNFNQTILVLGVLLECIYNSTDVTNITDMGDGNYSINFTAPSTIGIFDLFCNATSFNSTGNDTEQFTTETSTTEIVLNATPSQVSLENVTLFNNESFTIIANATNSGNGTAENTNLSFELLSGWSINSTLENCGDLNPFTSCIKHFNITVPNNTIPGSYLINLTTAWTNPDTTQGNNVTYINVTVEPNPQLDILEADISGNGADGVSRNVTSFTLLSSGSENATNISISCMSGDICNNFTVSFAPNNLSSLGIGENVTVSVIIDVPLLFSPGIYNGTINVSSDSGAAWDNETFFVTLQNTTFVSITTNPVNETIVKSIYDNVSFSIWTNITNIGNTSASSANLSYAIPQDWIINSSFEGCGNLTMDSSCIKNITVTLSTNTTSGLYNMNITSLWKNLNGTQGSNLFIFNVTVADNPLLDMENNTLTGGINENQTANVFNLTIMSIGSSNITGVAFNCTSGVVCNNFTLLFTPSSITTLAPGENLSVEINVTVPENFPEGVHTGTLNVTTSNNGNELVSLFVSVFPNRRWNMTPTFCQRSAFPDEGVVCGVNITNFGNADINFTIISVIANNTYPNVTNFSVAVGKSYSFSILYNVTGGPADIYNSTYLVSAVQSAGPQNITLNVTLLPYQSPDIVLEVTPQVAEQTEEILFVANITDVGFGIESVNITVTRPNNTIDYGNMTLISQSGNLSTWRIVYANATFGNTTDRGLYVFTICAKDSIGNVGNFTSNFTVHMKLNIVSRAFAQEYFQSDSATIFYSVRDINNSGVENVNASFSVRDQNSTLVYKTEQITDSYGTFEPLPVFSLASDALVGNYTLTSNSTYNDTVAGILVSVEKEYNFTVKEETVNVAGLFADIETTVTWYPNNIMQFSFLVFDGEGTPVDPTGLNLTVFDPADNIYFSIPLSSLTKEGTGFYSYDFAMPATTATGMYLAVLNVTRGTQNTMSLKAFRVSQGGPFDIRLVLLENEVEQGTPLDFNVIVENKGEVTQDVFINYTVRRTADNMTYYTASEAVLAPALTNQSFTRSAFVFSDQPLGTYTLTAVVAFDVTQPDIVASATFSVIAKKRVQPEEEAPEAGAPSTGEVTVVDEGDLLKSILIEKYNNNVRLSPGFVGVDNVIIRNTGRVKLNTIILNVLGVPESWFDITPAKHDELEEQDSTVFLIEYNIPDDVEVGDYKATLLVTSVEATDQKEITISVMESVDDLIAKEIEDLRRALRDLYIDIGIAKNQGKNVTSVLLLADQIEGTIDAAEDSFNAKDNDKALEYIKDAKVLLERARTLLASLTVKVEAADLSFWILLVLIIPVIIIVLFVLRRKKKLPEHMPHQVEHIISILNKLKPHPPDKKALMKERDNLKRMLVVLENEKKEGIVSDSAYNEMKKNVEGKVEKMEKKLEKIMKKK